VLHEAICRDQNLITRLAARADMKLYEQAG
jgi:hypothetical protein